ncbi:MAG: hypothetical protein ACFHX7_22115 [Pseudomonadota bacterium]
MKKLIAIVFILESLLVQPAFADETMTAEWTDLNYVLCEGLGIHGSGRVVVNARGYKSGNTMTIRDISVITKHPQSHLSSAKIYYTKPRGDKTSLNLMEPWFATISEDGSRILVLPRVMTSTERGSPTEQQAIHVRRGTNIELEVHVQFPQVGAGCIGNSTGELAVP